MDHKKYILDFQAKATGLQEIFNKIKDLTNTKNLDISKAVTGNLKSLETQLPVLMQTIEKALSKEDIQLIDFTEIHSQIKSVTRALSTTLNSVSKGNIKLELAEEIELIDNNIKKLEATMRSARGSLGAATKSATIGESGNYEITDYGKNRAFRESVGTVTIGEDVISTYDQLIEKQQELIASGKMNNELEKEYNEIIAQANEAIKVKEALYISTTQELREKFNVAKEALQQANAEREATTQSVIDTKASESEKELLGQITNLLSRLSSERQEATQILDDYNDEIKAEAEAERKAEKAKKDQIKLNQQSTKTVEKETGAFKKATKQVITYGTVIRLLKRAYTETINTVKDMDKALTGMAVVTNMSRKETWQLVGSFQSLAKETGKTSSEIAGMATKFYQQGKSTSQVLQLTEAAAKAATIAGIDGSRSIDLLTNAMNGFQLKASQAMEVSDKFAALAASAATDYEELATALSKVAAQANLAGLSMDFTLGLLTKGIEVTREAPETIGTALKTVISRMRELTDYGVTLEDNMDVNRVAKAFSNIGVEMMDSNGQFRDLEEVITEVGMKWDTLTTNQQANVAVAAAGTRQQSRFIAMMQDFDRTLELVEISSNSFGATIAQQGKYMEGLEASTTLLTNSWQSLVTNITNSELVIGAINLLSDAINVLVENTWAFWTILSLVLTGLLVWKAYAIVNTATLVAQATAQGVYNLQKQKELGIDKKGIIQKKIIEWLSKKKLVTTGLSIAATTAETAATKTATSAQWGLNAALMANPIDVILIAVLLFVAALAAWAAIIAIIITSHKTVDDRIKDTTKALEKLHAEIYQLQQSRSKVHGLAEEFDELSKKVIKTSEDMERMKEIADSINEEAGYTVVYDNMSDEEKYYAIKGYEQTLADKEQKKVEEMADTFAKSYNQVPAYQLSEFKEKLSNDAAFKATISTLAQNQIDGFKDFNKNTQQILIKTFQDHAWNYFDGNKFNFDEFAETYAKDIDLLNQTFDTDSLTEQYDLLQKMDAEFVNMVKQTNPLIAALSTMSEEQVATLDALNLTNEESNLLLSKMEELKNLGVEQSELDKIHEIASRSDLSNAEKRREIYSELNKLSKEQIEHKQKLANMSLEELQAVAASGDLAAQQLLEARQGLIEIQKELDEIAKKKAKLKDKDSDEAKELEQQETAANARQAQYEDIENKFANPVKDYIKSMQETMKIMGSAAVDDTIEGLTKLTNTIERLSKVNDLNSLSIQEQQELLKDYPELYEAMSKGYLTAAEKQEFFNKKFQELKDDAVNARDDLLKVADENFGFLNINWQDAKELQNIALMKRGSSDYDKYLAQIKAANPDFDDTDARNYLEQMINTASDLIENSYLTQNLEKNGISVVFSEDTKKIIADAQDLKKIAENEVAHYEELLKRTDAADANYEKIRQKRNEALLKSNAETQKQLEKEEAQFNDKMAGYEHLKDYYTIENGQVKVKAEILNDPEKFAELQMFLPDIQEWAEKQKEHTDDIFENNKKLAQDWLDQQKEITDALVDNLKERKKLYEEYFDALDDLQEEQESEEDRQSLIKQISALSGAVDGASKSRIKELQQKLNDLNKEQLKQQTEKQRNALLDAIDKEIEDANAKFDKMNENLYRIAQVISGEDGSVVINGKTYTQKDFTETLTGYSTGGMVYNTGPVMVHGSRSKPEAFLSAKDTANMQLLLSQLQLNLNQAAQIRRVQGIDNNLEGINIEQIIIKTEKLNDNQDFAKAGKVLAQELSQAMQKRGITINVKK